MKKQEILNQEESDRELSAVISAFSFIYLGRSKQVSYADTYNIVYKLCKNGQANQILSNLKNTTISHFSTTLAEMAKQRHQIPQYYQMIIQAQQSIENLSQILLYVDQNYLNNSKSEQNSIKQMLNSLFFQQILKEKSILDHIAELIAMSRCEKSCPQVVKIIQVINHLDQKEVFLPEFFVSFYRKIVSLHFRTIFEEYYNSNQLSAFLQYARLRFQQERQWLSQYYLRTKGKKIVDELLRKVYETSFDELKQKIYRQNSQQIFQSATLLFLQLLNEKNQPKEINDFNDWYIEQVKKNLQKIDRANNTQFLKEFVKEYLFISTCLSGVKSFNIGYKVTFFFEHWINGEKICLPKRLSIYFEDLILKNETNKEDLENFTILFKFLKQKDYFEKQFRRACALRMIFDPSKCKSETQNNMIAQMSNQCGSDWVQKLKKLKIALEQSESLKGCHSTSFKAIVFEDVVWPFPKLKKVPIIPKALLTLAGQFKEKYEQKFKGRSLQWHPFQGYAIIKINFGIFQQLFKVDTLMATLLLNLQSLKFKSSIKNVIGATKIPLQEIPDQLQVLEKGKVIKVEGSLKGEKIENLWVELNLDYKPSQSHRVVDLTHRYLEEQFTQKHGHEELKAERKMMVEALIVKIMKNSKTITLEGLYQQITPMIEARGYLFNKAFVDNALAGLIDKFIKGPENGTYSYLAS